MHRGRDRLMKGVWSSLEEARRWVEYRGGWVSEAGDYL